MKKVRIFILIFIIIVFSLLFSKTVDIINSKKCYGEYYRRVPVTGNINVSWTNIPQNYDEKLELADCAFLGKVKNIKETLYRNGMWVKPFVKNYDIYTIYEVEVLENIKGDNEINSSIEIIQMGGINKNKKSATLINDAIRLVDNEIYKFFPEKIEFEGEFYLDVSKPNLIEIVKNN